jgi:hypothetical protein
MAFSKVLLVGKDPLGRSGGPLAFVGRPLEAEGRSLTFAGRPSAPTGAVGTMSLGLNTARPGLN